MARITLNGFNQYNPAILNAGIVVPEPLEKEKMLANILYKCGDMYTYTQEPTALGYNIKLWFERKYDDFERMLKAYYSEYNPIHNFDRNEDFTDTPNITVTNSGKDQNINYTSDNYKATNETKNMISENKTSAFDSGDYVNDNKNELNGKVESTMQGKLHADVEYGLTTNTSGNTHHLGHLYGNIGVTRTQEMINDEINLRMLDVYNLITDMFIEEFIVQIY